MRNIGGTYNNNLPDQDPVQPVPTERERAAIRFMGQQVFGGATEWLYPANIISKTGTNATTDNNARQDTHLGHMMSAAMLNTILQNSTVPGTTPPQDAYPLPLYLNDLFNAVWQPLEGNSPWRDQARRQLERSYLVNIDQLLNPSESELRTASGQRNYTSDVIIFVYQHLQQIEHYCRQQLSEYPQGSVNAMHYEDLLHQITLIRERRNTPRR
jgi:hypothetical protein